MILLSLDFYRFILNLIFKLDVDFGAGQLKLFLNVTFRKNGHSKISRIIFLLQIWQGIWIEKWVADPHPYQILQSTDILGLLDLFKMWNLFLHFELFRNFSFEWRRKSLNTICWMLFIHIYLWDCNNFLGGL